MVSSKRFVPNYVRPSDVARGLVWDPLTLVWDRSSMPSRYVIDWGVCSKSVPVTRGRPLPYALYCYNRLPRLTAYRRLYLATKTRSKFLTKAHCRYRNERRSKHVRSVAIATKKERTRPFRNCRTEQRETVCRRVYLTRRPRLFFVEERERERERERETLCRRVYQTRRPSYFFVGSRVRDGLASFPRNPGAGGAHAKTARREQKWRPTPTPHTDHPRMITRARHARRRRPFESVGAFEFRRLYTTPGFQALSSGKVIIFVSYKFRARGLTRLTCGEGTAKFQSIKCKTMKMYNG